MELTPHIIKTGNHAYRYLVMTASTVSMILLTGGSKHCPLKTGKPGKTVYTQHNTGSIPVLIFTVLPLQHTWMNWKTTTGF